MSFISSRVRFVTVCFALLALVAGACGGGQTPSPAQDLGSVVVGIGTDPSLAPWVVAVEKGFFKKYGVTASLVPYANGPLSIQGILSGQVDIGGAGELTAIGPAAKGGLMTVVGTAWVSGKQTGITAKAGINKPKDLEGKNVGIVQGGVSQYYFEQYVVKYGLNKSTMTVKNIAQPDMVAAFARGDVDAYFLTEPALAKGVEAVPTAKIIARSGEDNVYFLHAFMVFAPKVISNKALTEASLKALIDGAEFTNSNRDEAVQIMAKWAKLDLPQTKAIMDNIDFAVRWAPDDQATITGVAKWMVQNKLIDKEPDWSVFLQTQFLKNVAPSRVK